RRRHTRSTRDWSSDVCSSDLDKASCAERPRAVNVVIVLADDLGYGDPRCYNPASRIPTPNIDRLAVQGMRFTDAHTPSAVCTPKIGRASCRERVWVSGRPVTV